MKNVLSIFICISCIIFTYGCKTLSQRTPISQENVSISTFRDRPTNINTLRSYEYGASSTSITNANDETGTIEFSQGGELAINMGSPCPFCAETIKISANLTEVQ
jgi:hypothetical protein